MNDLHDIKPLKDIYFFNIETLYFILFFIILSIFFHILFIYLGKMNNDNILKINIKSSNDSFYEDIYKRINFLDKNISNLNRSDFYSKFNIILKSLLEYRGYKGILSMSLSDINKEINNTHNNDIISILNSTYYLEFSDKLEDTINIREKKLILILDILNK